MCKKEGRSNLSVSTYNAPTFSAEGRKRLDRLTTVQPFSQTATTLQPFARVSTTVQPFCITGATLQPFCHHEPDAPTFSEKRPTLQPFWSGKKVGASLPSAKMKKSRKKVGASRLCITTVQPFVLAAATLQPFRAISLPLQPF